VTRHSRTVSTLSRIIV